MNIKPFPVAGVLHGGGNFGQYRPGVHQLVGQGGDVQRGLAKGAGSLPYGGGNRAGFDTVGQQLAIGAAFQHTPDAGEYRLLHVQFAPVQQLHPTGHLAFAQQLVDQLAVGGVKLADVLHRINLGIPLVALQLGNQLGNHLFGGMQVFHFFRSGQGGLVETVDFAR